MANRTRVKICGLTREQDVDDAVAAGADAIGLVFAPGSPRRLGAGRAAELRRRVPPFVTVVGLFVNESLESMNACIDAVRLDAVQLHGDEDVEVAAALASRTRVIKAFRMSGPEVIARMPPFAPVTGAWLLDAWVPGVAGGTGARFDWELALRAQALGHPVILAGGLKPENAAEAVARVAPYALDVSSGVESSPGIKDPLKVLRFVAAAS